MKRTNVLAACAAILGVVSVTGFAVANEPYFPRSQRGFERVDVNKDGKISLSEFTPIPDRGLAKADLNGDKVVTPKEIDDLFMARIAKRRDRIMQLLDSNKDKQITDAELDKVVEDMFNTADMDKDGGLTFVEMRQFKRSAWRKAYLGDGNGTRLSSSN